MFVIVVDGKEVHRVDQDVRDVSFRTSEGEAGKVKFRGSGTVHIVTTKGDKATPNFSEVSGETENIKGTALRHAELVSAAKPAAGTSPVVTPKFKSKMFVSSSKEANKE